MHERSLSLSYQYKQKRSNQNQEVVNTVVQHDLLYPGQPREIQVVVKVTLLNCRSTAKIMEGVLKSLVIVVTKPLKNFPSIKFVVLQSKSAPDSHLILYETLKTSKLD